MQKYIVINSTIIDNPWMSHRTVFETYEEALKKAKRLSYQERKDFYIAEIRSSVEPNIDAKTKEVKLLENDNDI